MVVPPSRPAGRDGDPVGEHTPLRRRWTNTEIVVFPTAILAEKLSPTGLRLWIALAQFANDDRQCWPSRRTLAERLPAGVALGTIRRARAELEAADLLRVEYRNDARNGRETTPLYTLMVPVGEGDENGRGEGDENAPHEGDQNAPPLNLTNKPKQKEEVDEVRVVFDAWVEATGKHPTRTRLDNKRRRTITKALKDHPVEDVLDAVVGWQHDPFYCGENDRGRPFNDLGLLLRDAEHVERFRDMARSVSISPPVKTDPNVKVDEAGNTMRFVAGTGWMRTP